MAGVSESIKGLGAARARLQRLMKGPDDTIKNRIGKTAVAGVQSNFRGNPLGWTGNSAMTLYLKSSSAPLMDKGLLRSNTTFRIVGDVIEIVNNRIYAAAQHFGGSWKVPVTKKMRKFFWAMWYKHGEPRFKNLALTKKTTLTIKIPKRPFMVLRDEHKNAIKQILAGWMR